MALVRELDASGNVVRDYGDGGEVRYGAGPGGADQKLSYTADHLGSLRSLVDDSGTVVASYEYDPYGRRTQVAGTESSDFGFTGHWVHAASGLVLAPLRVYDPETARWLSRDPIGEAGGANLYAYCGGDPVNCADPLGLSCKDVLRDLHDKIQQTIDISDYVFEFVLGVSIGLALGAFGATLLGGILAGALAGGIAAAARGESFFGGFTAGAFGGALGYGLGKLLGKGLSALGKRLGPGLKNLLARFKAPKATTGGVDDTIDVYRVYGGDARAKGFSWTTVNPRTVKDFRNGAGLPSGGPSGATNTADFLLKGRVKKSDVMEFKSADPLDGNSGGLPELIIDPQNVKLFDFSVLNP